MHYLQGVTALNAGVSTVEVTYPESLSGSVHVWPQVANLAEQVDPILLFPFVMEATATGFKVGFNGQTDSTEYSLFWHAGDPLEAGGTANEWIHGEGVPDDGADGEEDDFYLDTLTGDTYHKQGGSWVLIGNFSGSDGTVWHTDSGPPSDALGKNGDFYLDQDTNNYYEKQSGTWVQQGTLGSGGSSGSGSGVFIDILRRVGSLVYRKSPVRDKDLFVMVDTKGQWKTQAVDFERLSSEMVRKRAQVPGNTITPSAKYLEMALDPASGILYVNDGTKWGRIQLNFDWWP